MSRAEDEGMQGHAPWLADPVQSETPAGLLPVSARGKHEIEAAGGWVVACGAYDEYGCMPTEARDYIVATLNARAASQERPQLCDRIVNNGMGEPTECGRSWPCEYHDPPQERPPIDVERRCPDCNLTAQQIGEFHIRAQEAARLSGSVGKP